MTDFMVSYTKGKGTCRQYVNGRPVTISWFDHMELLCKKGNKQYTLIREVDTPKFKQVYYSYN